ncbi:MAG: 2-isopropylmalate synthase [Oscillospiraceae bacterium]|nr:2-isopropylmalate synthase [Oscillospiraceae bacterium]
MKNAEKYKPLYYMPPEAITDWITKDRLTKPPVWCSVDLRDGNQALVIPMSLEEKVAYYKFLVQIGFKEIEVGFPAASETEYEFLRILIDQDMIPDDVTVQVLTQSREHIIEKTFAAVKGAKRVVMHLYNSTSFAQRQQVFRMIEDEIIAIAREGARLFNKFAKSMPETRFDFEYSPESFTGTEPAFALDICNAVIDIWKEGPAKRMIINLPATVETSMPHVYAQQIAYMNRHLNHREDVIISLHPHNDRGTGVAAAEMGLLAGADRVEGTLFGNGERTGNVDLITLALNLYTHGIDPGLNLSDMPAVVRAYEEWTGLQVGPRHPYAGELVFAAFSGSHQDAIAKGMNFRKERDEPHWTVPYLPLDPADVNREYEADVIRINSQSGKGGISYILERNFGYNLPKDLRAEVGMLIKDISDKAHKELSPKEILGAFVTSYVNFAQPIELVNVDWRREGERTIAELDLRIRGEKYTVIGRGNGSLDAVSRALRGADLQLIFKFEDYYQHALETESDARAAAYVKISDKDGKSYWGIGVHNDITTASTYALISAINRENIVWRFVE